MRLLLTLFLSITFSVIAQSSVIAAEITDSDIQALQIQLQNWNDRAKQITNLEAKIQTIEVIADADNDDRHWWNPFWRSRRVRQLQEINQITLSIQHLDGKLQAQREMLKPLVEQYIGKCLNSRPVSEETLMLWKKTDEWRFNQLLNQIDISRLEKQLKQSHHAELRENRIKQLQLFITAIENISAYIKQRLSQTTNDENQFYKQWYEKFTQQMNEGVIVRQKYNTSQ